MAIGKNPNSKKILSVKEAVKMLEQLMEALRARGLTEDEIQSVIQEAQVKTQLVQLANQFVRQVLSIGNWQDGFGQVDLTIAIAEDDDGNLVGWQWQLTGHHGSIGTIVISGTIDLPAQGQDSSQGQSEGQSKSKSKSNWARVIELADRYGIEVKPYEKKAIAWYAGTILTRIAKNRPEAKNDPEFVTLAQAWNTNKSQNAPEAKVN